MDSAVSLISELVRFMTTADSPEELGRCADYIAGCLRHKGIIVRRHERKGKVSVVALFEDTKSPEIFLNAHFDVVPASSHLFVPRIEGDRLYARGSEDCKAQVAILMLLMLHFASQKHKPDVGLMLTSDEEVHGENGVAYLLSELGYSCRFAIVADGGDNFDIVTKHKGVLQVRLSAVGKSCHSARPWDGGDNAIAKLIDAYPNVEKMFPPLDRPAWKTTASLNRIAGGDALNKVPEYAEMFLDIRHTESDSPVKIIRMLSGLGLQVEVVSQADMLVNDEANPYIMKLQSCAGRVLGRKIRLSHEHGATDARYFSAAGIPAAIFKPLGAGAHSDAEHVVISSLQPYFDILVDFVRPSVKKLT